jgi:hypothetical protein
MKTARYECSKCCMKTLLIVLGMAVAARGSEPQVDLRGIPSVIVTVANRSAGTGTCSADSHPLESLGVDVAAVLTETQYRLREAGVKIPEFVPATASVPNLTVALSACGKYMSVEVGLWESVTVRGMPAKAITWGVDGGQYGGTPETYRSSIRDAISHFLNAWLRDNKWRYNSPR